MKLGSDRVDDFTWYVLQVLTSHEKQVERWLARDGFATFAPMARKWRHKTRVNRAKRKKVGMRVAIFPGYVFIGMNDTTPSWRSVFRFGPVLHVIGEEGRPAPMRTSKLIELMDAHSRGKFSAPDHHRQMQTHREFEPGDVVVTEDGLLEARVKEVTGARARLLIDLFGGEREIDAETARLVRAA